MAQQTINVGSAPNDGTGTPLRTAFQYTNSNFTELYTAVGPSGNNIVVPGSATITGDLTVDTSTLKVNSSTNRVGVLTASPESELDVRGLVAVRGTPTFPSTGVGLEMYHDAANTSSYIQSYDRGGSAFYNLSYKALSHFFQLSSGTAMTLNATGLGVGGSPTSKLTIGTGSFSAAASGTTGMYTTASGLEMLSDSYFFGSRAGGGLMTLNSSGNVGIGVTPSAWGSTSYSVAALQNPAGAFWNYQTSIVSMVQNAFYNNSAQYIYKNNGFASEYYQSSGQHIWRTAPSGTANDPLAGAYAFVQNMTLDASGNLLVGPTSGSVHTFSKAAALGSGILTVSSSTTGYTTATFYGADNTGANAANTAMLINKNNTTGRSINGAGTINASGADYAEYMTKASDFVLAKGGIAGIDANGKLTNVFADAISFVVKSTDPSYVGNDKWGVDLEGDALEAARQLVDRIAFAGQVPVNVTGAKAGDYIVPVVDGTGIKGIAVTSPTFEQYQIAVGKVIAIDTDGRARIIVKVA